MSDLRDVTGTCPDCGEPLDVDNLACERHDMHQAGGERRGGPNRRAPSGVTAAGRPERRNHERRHGQRRRDERDHEPVTRGEFRRRGRRDRLLFGVLALISCAAGLFGYQQGVDAGDDVSANAVETAAGLARNGAQATFDTCVSGGDLRIVTARGLDDLRTLALTRQVNAAARAEFIRGTQPAIDALLTQAAGRPYQAPLPPGRVTRAVQRDVRFLSIARCIVRADRAFPGVKVTLR